MQKIVIKCSKFCWLFTKQPIFASVHQLKNEDPASRTCFNSCTLLKKHFHTRMDSRILPHEHWMMTIAWAKEKTNLIVPTNDRTRHRIGGEFWFGFLSGKGKSTVETWNIIVCFWAIIFLSVIINFFFCLVITVVIVFDIIVLIKWFFIIKFMDKPVSMIPSNFLIIFFIWPVLYNMVKTFILMGEEINILQ